jgi:uncharacterized protein HemX
MKKAIAAVSLVLAVIIFGLGVVAFGQDKPQAPTRDQIVAQIQSLSGEYNARNKDMNTAAGQMVQIGVQITDLQRQLNAMDEAAKKADAKGVADRLKDADKAGKAAPKK